MLSLNGLFAQVPDVHEEAHHKQIYEYGSFRYLRVEAAPGDTTAMHNHRLSILYLNLYHAEVWLDEAGIAPRTATLPEYWVGSNHYEFNDPMVHRFAVTGAQALYLIAVERSFAESLAPFNAWEKPVYQMHGFVVFEITTADYLAYCKAGAYPAIVKIGEGYLEPGQFLTCTEANTHASDALDKSLLWLVLPE